MHDNKDASALQAWMIRYLSEHLNIDRNCIKSTDRFEHIGVDSITVIAMNGELENYLGRTISPTSIYDYSTIEEFADFLASPQSK